MIAQRSGTTATALALANCLTNADFIQAGQVLRVPVLLPTATRTVAPQTWIPQNVVVTATPTTTIIPLGTRLP